VDPHFCSDRAAGEFNSSDVRFHSPMSVVVAPRELWRALDMLTLLLSDQQNIFVVRVPCERPEVG
jgi:hypothetical protein